MSFYYDEDEDEACLACGELDFRESRLPGLCVDCAAEGTERDSDVFAADDDNYRRHV